MAGKSNNHVGCVNQKKRKRQESSNTLGSLVFSLGVYLLVVGRTLAGESGRDGRGGEVIQEFSKQLGYTRPARGKVVTSLRSRSPRTADQRIRKGEDRNPVGSPWGQTESGDVPMCRSGRRVGISGGMERSTRKGTDRREEGSPGAALQRKRKLRGSCTRRLKAKRGRGKQRRVREQRSLE